MTVVAMPSAFPSGKEMRIRTEVEVYPEDGLRPFVIVVQYSETANP